MSGDNIKKTKKAVPASEVKEKMSEPRKVIAGLWASLGFGGNKKEEPEGGSDIGTQLAHERTGLATERPYMAADRTLMAWIRTALSMISFGFTIGKLGQALTVSGVRGVHEIGTDTIAYFLVVLGTAALLAAAYQHTRTVHELCEQGLKRRFSISLVVSLVLSVMGILAFTALVMKL